jgi:predicted outer membrane lipoprotein
MPVATGLLLPIILVFAILNAMWLEVRQGNEERDGLSRD